MSANLSNHVEALLKQDPLSTPVLDTGEVQHLVQALLVRQRELEKQNQALRQSPVYTPGRYDPSMASRDIASGTGDDRDLAQFQQQLEELAARRAEELRASESRFRSTVNNLLVGVVVHGVDHSVVYSNSQACQLLGLSLPQMLGEEPISDDWEFINEDQSVVAFEDYPLSRVIATGKSVAYECMGVRQPGRTDITWLTGSAIPVFTQDNVLDQVIVNFMDVTELKRLQQALQKRVLALTHPLDEPAGIAFDDLFNLSEIQRIQDEFSTATGVASVIVDSQGCPVTRPSNFSELGTHISQIAAAGSADCFSAHAVAAQRDAQGPVIRQCPRSGLWDAGASIEIDGRHLATWLIGQVRDEDWNEAQVRAYANEIGADESLVVDAYSRVPPMAPDQFRNIAQALFTLARQLSTAAYHNVQQARFIEEQKRSEQALQDSEEKYRKLFESESDAILIIDGEKRQIVDVNNAAIELYGYTREDFLQLDPVVITTRPDLAEETIFTALAEASLPVMRARHRKKNGACFLAEVKVFSFFLQRRPVVCAVIHDTTERVAFEKERRKNREELRKLASELSLAEQHERERIGRELHDGVSQLLSSSLLRLNVLKDVQLPAMAVESLDTVCGILTRALDDIRSLTFELSCPLLNELGLAAALEELCSSMRREYSIDFAFSGETRRLAVSMDREIALYRSTRELLINVMKHSGAKRACVHLQQVADRVRICVQDDGVGFDARSAGRGFSPTGGFGLFNIREYIRHAGGNLLIESTPGDGTQIVLEVPLEAAHG